VGSPVRVGDEQPSHRSAPRRHEDTPYNLGGVLGYRAERIDDLIAGGAFGQ
jgi:hypothetical protein